MTNKDLHLKENPTLADFQRYVKDMVEVRGFDKKSTTDLFLLFVEECGEMAKAIRSTNKVMRMDPNSKKQNLPHEIADVFIYLLDICNHFDVDLEQAFREKEEINKTRTWE